MCRVDHGSQPLRKGSGGRINSIRALLPASGPRRASLVWRKSLSEEALQTIEFIGYVCFRPAFKLPERLELVEEFPLSNVGKVLKRTLVEQITAKLKAEGAL